MRYVLLLLCLSSPAYAALWNLEATFADEFNNIIDTTGAFTVENNRITAYNIRSGGNPAFPKGGCSESDASLCNSAELIDPMHLRFFFAASPATTLKLDLFLAAPIDSGQDPIALLPSTDFAYNYGMTHPAFIAGSITDPLVIPEPSTLGIAGTIWIALMTAQRRRANRRRCTRPCLAPAPGWWSSRLPSRWQSASLTR